MSIPAIRQIVLVATILACVCAAARRARADGYATESLLRDLERIVDAEESVGWFTDDDAFFNVRADVLSSVCRAPVAARTAALAALRAESSAAGDSRSLYLAKCRQVDADVERARFIERQILVLERALATASASCPYWVEPDPEFRGRQSNRDRLTLGFESGGNAQLRQTSGTVTIGAGGLGRLFVGYGIRGNVTLLTGIEFGGGAMLKPGVEPTEFVVNYFPAIPFVLRLHQVAWHYDVELAPVALFQADDGSLSYGFRTGVGLGLSGLRRRNLIPWAGTVLAYEHYFESGDRPGAHFLRGGVRVGVTWDFGVD